MDKVIARIKNILVTPDAALDELKDESINVTETMKQYVAVAGAIPGAAMFFGLIGPHPPILRSLLYGALIYGICVAGVLAFGKIVDALAPHFNSTKNDLNAFKVSLAAFTPSFVSGIFNLNPNLTFLWVLGSFYGAYILYLALPRLMETPEDKRIAYAGISSVVIYLAMFVLWRIAKGIALGDISQSFR